MNQYVDNILRAFAELDDDNDQLQRILTLSPELGWAEEEDIDLMIVRLAELSGGISPNILDRGLEVVIGRLSRDAAEGDSGETQRAASSTRIEAVTTLYMGLPDETRTRNYLLNWLATMRSPQSLEQFCKLVVESPPTNSGSIVVAFAPLLQHQKSFDVDLMFPRLLGGLQHRSVAAAILDLANFVTRQNRTDQHPAGPHLETLIAMLGMLTEQLSMLEEGNVPEGKSPEDISDMVNDTVSLIASLCDALSLIGNSDAIGKLNRAAELKHRRIRTEALSALCSLGQEGAGEQLVKLAAEPVIRLRVLKYAEELGLSESIEERYSSETAQAESQLAMWLAHPSNMGLAPRSLELLDHRCLAWPGYDDVVDCYLFRYSYELMHARIDNIGIVGPLSHAFSMNLQHLNLSDVYACFAGWHGTHDEIMEMSIPQARLQRPGLVERYMSRLSTGQMENITDNDVEPLFLGLFMGDEALVAAGTRNGLRGTWVIDVDQMYWFPPDQDDSSARNDLAYCIYKGRRLLGAFNQPEVWPGTQTECLE